MFNENDNTSKSEDKKISEETENLIKEPEQALKNYEKENLFELKKSTKELSEISKEESLKLTKLVEKKEIEIKNLNDEKILLERNNIQLDIQKNQQLIIDEYKDNNKKLKLDLDELQGKIVELESSNRKFLINNDELKKTLNRYIIHNKNLQSSINDLNKIQSEYLESKSQINKMTEQIKFYQEDNSRLANETINIQKKYATIKNNFDTADKEKNDIFRQIQELNNSLSSNNIVGTSFVKEIVDEDSINSKVLNDISNNNLLEEKKKSEKKILLDDKINDIFK
jgi:hypothetical protein